MRFQNPYENYVRVYEALDEGVQDFCFDGMFSVGAIYRSALRMNLHRRGLRFTEEKSLTGSLFIVKVRDMYDAEEFAGLGLQIDRMQAERRAEETIRTRQERIIENRFRRLTFRKPFKVPFEGWSKEKLTKAFMQA